MSQEFSIDPAVMLAKSTAEDCLLKTAQAYSTYAICAPVGTERQLAQSRAEQFKNFVYADQQGATNIASQQDKSVDKSVDKPANEPSEMRQAVSLIIWRIKAWIVIILCIIMMFVAGDAISDRCNKSNMTESYTFSDKPIQNAAEQYGHRLVLEILEHSDYVSVTEAHDIWTKVRRASNVPNYFSENMDKKSELYWFMQKSPKQIYEEIKDNAFFRPFTRCHGNSSVWI